MQNERIEAYLLGLCLTKTNKKYIADLAETDFTNTKHKQIYNALQEAGETPDIQALHTIFLKKQGASIAGEMISYCMYIMDEAITDVNASKQKQELQVCTQRRAVYQSLLKAMQDVQDPATILQDVCDSAVTSLKVQNLQGENAWANMGEIAQRFVQYLDDVATGKKKRMKSNIFAIDSLTGGFQKGELTIIGARPAVGKSALATVIATNLAKQKFNVLFVSREMSDTQYAQRLFATLGNIDASIFKGDIATDNNFWEQAGDIVNQMAQLPMEFIFQMPYIEDIKSAVIQKAHQGKCDVLIVDYIQLLQTKKQFAQDHLRVAYISQILKDLSLSLQIPIIALAQVKRTDGTNRLPMLSELKDSGSLEQDADCVIFMHKPDDDKDKSINPKDQLIFNRFMHNKQEQYIVIHVAKNRQGATGKCSIVFRPNHMRYEDIALYRQ